MHASLHVRPQPIWRCLCAVQLIANYPYRRVQSIARSWSVSGVRRTRFRTSVPGQKSQISRGFSFGPDSEDGVLASVVRRERDCHQALLERAPNVAVPLIFLCAA
jgi:hypothetical protein